MLVTRSPLLLATIMAATSAFLPEPAAAQKRQRDVITREEILNSAHRNLDLYQVVRSLRPHFLAPPRGVRTLGNAPPAAAVVYIDRNRAGGIEQLRLLSPAGVEEVRYLDPSRAENQFGITHSGGAILVTLVKEKPSGVAQPPPPGLEKRLHLESIRRSGTP